MRVKIASMLAATAFLAACDSAFDSETMTCGQGGADATCPPAPGTAADFVANVGDRVFFEFDKSSVKPEGKETLSKQAEWLNKYASTTVTVEGHCDERGTSEYNMGLGQRRADTTKKSLTSMGVAPSRVKTLSYGKERPVVPGNDESAWSQNRVAITVVD
ncbi:MAG: peptidoglycan-associated lipoprotein Pal [Alphaproteobacteria bacterium]